MPISTTKIIVVVLVVIAAVGGALLYLVSREAPAEPALAQVVRPVQTGPVEKLIGLSVQGRDIRAYTYGSGPTRLVFVGGMHGGYEWNSVLLAYQFMDYLVQNPSTIPAALSITVIPDVNPDGVFKIIGKEGRFDIADVPSGDSSVGRFNAHEVDLNRNFDCNWKSEATWRGTKESAGAAPFSEPEAVAIRDFALQNKPAAFVFWHSQSNAVYASQCNAGILPQTLDIMNAYSKASGYPAVESFDAYPVTGDSEGWLASINIPAITVELQTHETVEWERNLKGIQALLTYYGNKPVTQ